MTKHTILFLAANPLGTDRLALDEEARAIQEELERSGHRDRFQLVTRWAVRPLDLLRELRKLKPTVVHFSGHGGRGERRPGAEQQRDIVSELGPDNGVAAVSELQHGLFFQGPDGKPQLVSTAALQQAFGAAGSSVKLVVLNACYSNMQAEALLEHVACVVGLGGSIANDAARSFAVGFYGGVGECETVAAAFKQGLAAVSLEGLPDDEWPELKTRDGIDAKQLVLTAVCSNADEMVAPRQLGWTWRSSIESAEMGDVSVLAIAETFAASGVYALIGWRFGTLHLTISALVAPFLLLRTQRSITLALTWFDIWYQPKRNKGRIFIRPDNNWRRDIYGDNWLRDIFGEIFGLLFSFTIPLIIIRFTATAVAAVISPLDAIREISRNWWRSVASIDSCYPLETLQGSYRRYGSDLDNTRLEIALMPSKGIRAVMRMFNPATQGRLFVYGLCICIMILLAPPVLFYRWSLKGSALIYSPLIWIVYGATARSLRVHLEDLLNLAYYKINRGFAVLVLLLFALKVYVHYSWDDFAHSWREVPGSKLLDAVVMPEAFPPWQITSVVNAVLAWFLYLVADWAIARWERGLQIQEKLVEIMLRWLSLARGLLSVYTIFSGIYLAASLSGRFGLPPMGTGILPWR